MESVARADAGGVAQVGADAEEEPQGTKALIVEAALGTLRSKGFAGCSAREIARAGSFNQALIFYHFGTVHRLLLAALDRVSDRRMRAYEPAFTQARTVSELATLAREIYSEDLQNGYVTVLVEMVAGGIADVELGSEVAARLEPWTNMIARQVRSLVAGSVLESIVPPREAAFAIVALYMGIDMLSQLDGEHARAESLLDLGIRHAPLAEVLLRPGQAGGM